MRVEFDTEEREVLCQRLLLGPEATDAKLTAAFKKWAGDKPQARPRRRSLRSRVPGLPGSRAEQAAAGGYQGNAGYIGRG